MPISRLSLAAILTGLAATGAALAEPVAVTVDNFDRAETNEIMKSYVGVAGIGEWVHNRAPTPIDQQNVVRMNRDTLYSFAVVDMSTPVTIVKPESDRFQSMLLINEEHSMLPAIHEDGTFTIPPSLVGTRYLAVVIRTFADPNDPEDVKAANTLQDKLQIIQPDKGAFEIPDWDPESLARVRDAIKVLGNTRSDTTPYFGQKALLNPLYHLIGTAVGWGGNPPEAAMYTLGLVPNNDGTPYTVTAKDVPVDGFWSVTVYNAQGFMEANDLGVYSYNNVTAKPNADGGYTINFGGCADGRINCIPIMQGWNYAIRLYQPRAKILDGTWRFPDFQPAG